MIRRITRISASSHLYFKNTLCAARPDPHYLQIIRADLAFTKNSFRAKSPKIQQEKEHTMLPTSLIFYCLPSLFAIFKGLIIPGDSR